MCIKCLVFLVTPNPDLFHLGIIMPGALVNPNQP